MRQELSHQPRTTLEIFLILGGLLLVSCPAAHWLTHHQWIHISPPSLAQILAQISLFKKQTKTFLGLTFQVKSIFWGRAVGGQIKNSGLWPASSLRKSL